MSDQPAAAGPPRLPFVLSVGVTGHRIDTLPAEGTAAITERLQAALQLLTDAALELHRTELGCFDGQPPRFQIISPLADGADKIAAEAALALGYELHAVLPFARHEYRPDLIGDEAQDRFDRLVEKSGCVLELPGDRSHEFEGYVMTGRATVAHCDVLLAVWDGLKARGRGGTAEVVELAIKRGTPVVHIPTDPKRAARLMWAAFDPVVDTQGDDPMAERPLEADSVEQMLRGLLLPPPNKQEQTFIQRFWHERLRNLRTRFEYPLLLTATGVRRMRLGDVREKHADEQIREEWQRHREDCAEAHDIHAPIDLLENAYRWSDRLATHFAQSYRSGHIFNFVLGGLAVCMGLSAFMIQRYQFIEAAFEMVITLGIILNAHIAARNEWHRRWLDYRQLAERLRPMRSLKLLGIAAPDPPGTETNPVPRRWIDWYATGIWRALSCPAATINRERADRLATAIADHEVAPQVGYHKRNSRLIAQLDERLGKLGFALFAVTLVVSVVALIGMATGAQFVNTYSNWFTLVSAGFPALGTAVFGIRFQGDFGGDAVRSLATAETLEHIEQELRKEITLTRAADLTEQAARIMLSDLDEWRLVNQQRDLSVG